MNLTSWPDISQRNRDVHCACSMRKWLLCRSTYDCAALWSVRCVAPTVYWTRNRNLRIEPTWLWTVCGRKPKQITLWHHSAKLKTKKKAVVFKTNKTRCYETHNCVLFHSTHIGMRQILIQQLQYSSVIDNERSKRLSYHTIALHNREGYYYASDYTYRVLLCNYAGVITITYKRQSNKKMTFSIQTNRTIHFPIY